MNPKYCCEVEPENMPDFVAVVRCKDCTFLHDEGNGEYGCTIHDDLYVSADDWFCADGERKEGDEVNGKPILRNDS